MFLKKCNTLAYFVPKIVCIQVNNTTKTNFTRYKGIFNSNTFTEVDDMFNCLKRFTMKPLQVYKIMIFMKKINESYTFVLLRTRPLLSVQGVGALIHFFGNEFTRYFY